MTEPKYKLLSLFTGAGGFDLGFELTNRWETVAAFDNHPMMLETLRRNQGLRLIEGTKFLSNADIVDIDLSTVKEENLSAYQDVDLVLGGPPCQDFSAVGKQLGYEHSKGTLIDSFKSIVYQLMPSAFLFENVPNMKSEKWLSNFQTYLELLTFSGAYRVQDFLLNCADYGAATVRKRVFILGFHERTGLKPTFPKPTHGDSVQPGLFETHLPHVAVGKVLKGLNPPKTQLCEDGHFAPLHEQEVIKRFENLKAGERDNARRRNRLFNDKPAFTLFAGGEKGGTRTHIHPTEPREITPRECARIHGFPDEFLFAGNKSQIAIQIANSVPVPMAAAWGDYLAKALDSQ